jgi:hypothetical protein
MTEVAKPSQRMEPLIETLLKQTQAGAIQWTATDIPGAFAYVGKHGSVIIRGPGTGVLRSLFAGHSIQALSSGGQKVEYYQAGGILGAEWEPLVNLYQAVRTRYAEGSPLLDALTREIADARPSR